METKELIAVTYRLINGTFSRKTPVGYCSFYKHPGHISKHLMDLKGCNQKSCRHFQKTEGHPYWEERARINALKKAKKDGRFTYEFNGKQYLIK